MKTIKYKARRISNYVIGEWIIGEPHVSSAAIPHLHVRAGESHQILAKTVCQFIGMQDHKQVDLYESDRVKSLLTDELGTIVWDVEYLEYFVLWDNGKSDRLDISMTPELEFIGNEYDNQD